MIRAYMSPMPLQEFQSARTLILEPNVNRFDGDPWGSPPFENKATFASVEDNALLRDDFKFFATEGATYFISSGSFFDPFILRLYDNNRNFLASDDGQGFEGSDTIYGYQATYTGYHYVSASWNQGTT